MIEVREHDRSRHQVRIANSLCQHRQRLFIRAVILALENPGVLKLRPVDAAIDAVVVVVLVVRGPVTIRWRARSQRVELRQSIRIL